jgi:Ca-activated chloride channel family protein
MSIEIRAEHSKAKGGSRTQLGLMIEVTAPVAPVVETEIQRSDKGVVFCIDRSGSMSNGRLELVKQTVLDILPKLRATDYISVVTFDHAATVVAPMKKVQDHTVASLRALVAGITTGGQTNLELGYRTALAEAALAPEVLETQVILLSDGQANSGATDPTLLGQLAASAIEHLISTSTLGIGEGYSEQLLDVLAVSGNGNHFSAFRLEEAVDGLNSEIEGLLKRTIEGLRIDIQYEPCFQAGSIAKTVQNLKFFASGANGAAATLGDLSSGEERNFTFDLDLKAQDFSHGGTEPAFTVSYSYQDLVSGQEVTGEQRFELEIADPTNFVEPERDQDIVAELAALRAQEIKERAIELMRSGRETEARELMAKIGQDLSELMSRFEGLSERQRGRVQSQVNESSFLSAAMSSDEFIKRGTESINRARKSKPDPRNKN